MKVVTPTTTTRRRRTTLSVPWPVGFAAGKKMCGIRVDDWMEEEEEEARHCDVSWLAISLGRGGRRKRSRSPFLSRFFCVSPGCEWGGKEEEEKGGKSVFGSSLRFAQWQGESIRLLNTRRILIPLYTILEMVWKECFPPSQFFPLFGAGETESGEKNSQSCACSVACEKSLSWRRSLRCVRFTWKRKHFSLSRSSWEYSLLSARRERRRNGPSFLLLFLLQLLSQIVKIRLQNFAAFRENTGRSKCLFWSFLAEFT